MFGNKEKFKIKLVLDEFEFEFFEGSLKEMLKVIKQWKKLRPDLKGYANNAINDFNSRPQPQMYPPQANPFYGPPQQPPYPQQQQPYPQQPYPQQPRQLPQPPMPPQQLMPQPQPQPQQPQQPQYDYQPQNFGMGSQPQPAQPPVPRPKKAVQEVPNEVPPLNVPQSKPIIPPRGRTTVKVK